MSKFDIANWVKTARKNAKITQEVLALELGFATKSSISAIEIGKNKPSYETLLKISQICGYPLPYQDTNIVPVYELTTNFKLPFYDCVQDFPTIQSMQAEMDKHILLPKFILEQKRIDAKNVICLRMIGTNMSPLIPDESYLIANISNQHIADGRIYAIFQENLFRIRMLYNLTGNKVRLKSWNETEFLEEVIDKNDLNIVGKIEAWIAFS